MLLVKSAEIYKTDDYEARILKQTQEPDFYPKDFPQRCDIQVEEEVVRGQTFVNEAGEWVVIGWSTELQEALSLPFKCLRDQGERIEKLEEENRHFRERLSQFASLHAEAEGRCTALDERLRSFQNKSFWQRLKWAFKPY